jgi:tRNA G26 N,N-dimethylase Trm1
VVQNKQKEDTDAMNKSQLLLKTVENYSLLEASSLEAANRILTTVKNWNSQNVGASPLAKELKYPEDFVAKVLDHISKQGFLKPTGKGVYSTVKTEKPLQSVESFLPNGKIKHKLVDKSDPWQIRARPLR